MDMEELRLGDMVILPGPDSDPPVARDVSYVLDRPTGRSYKMAYGSQWLWQHLGHSFDFVLYLDDDAFVSLPRRRERACACSCQSSSELL